MSLIKSAESIDEAIPLVAIPTFVFIKLTKMKFVIIGGVAGGASAAARLRRLNEKATIILFEKGDFISYANCGLPYYIGDVIKERNKKAYLKRKEKLEKEKLLTI
mgnify:CR=1 FL=1